MHRIARIRCGQEDQRLSAALPEFLNEMLRVTVGQIHIQQSHVHRAALKRAQRCFDRSAACGDAEVGMRRQQLRKSLPGLHIAVNQYRIDQSKSPFL